MAASFRDAEAAHGVVQDAVVVLRWCAGSESLLTIGQERRAPVMRARLLGLYRETLDQFETTYFALALLTLRGENQDFPLDRVLTLLDLTGWTGPALDFKLAVLDAGGREEVVSTARIGAGPIRRVVFRRFVGVLNAALGSLQGVPGVGAIKELKDFVEGA